MWHGRPARDVRERHLRGESMARTRGRDATDHACRLRLRDGEARDQGFSVVCEADAVDTVG
jgi:hypothetical protein